MSSRYKTRFETYIKPGDLVSLTREYITYDNRIISGGELGLVLAYADAWISGSGILCLVRWQCTDHIMRIYECDLEKIS